jgi:hypothetical protein
MLLKIRYLIGFYEMVYACQLDGITILLVQFRILFVHFGSVVYL